jgi:predicted nucleotidyltransferase
MHPLIENNRETIVRLCRLHGVRSLEAFGSILRDDFDACTLDSATLCETAGHVYSEKLCNQMAA